MCADARSGGLQHPAACNAEIKCIRYRHDLFDHAFAPPSFFSFTSGMNSRDLALGFFRCHHTCNRKPCRNTKLFSLNLFTRHGGTWRRHVRTFGKHKNCEEGCPAHSGDLSEEDQVPDEDVVRMYLNLEQTLNPEDIPAAMAKFSPYIRNWDSLVAQAKQDL